MTQIETLVIRISTIISSLVCCRFASIMGLVSPKTREAMKGALDKIDGSVVKVVAVNVALAVLVWIFIALNFLKQIIQPFYR